MPLFTFLSTHSLHLCLDLQLPGKNSLSLCLIHSFSQSLSFLPPFFSFSVDCKPAGGLIEDAFLWGTEVIVFMRSASLSKADTLLKSYGSPVVHGEMLKRS